MFVIIVVLGTHAAEIHSVSDNTKILFDSVIVEVMNYTQDIEGLIPIILSALRRSYKCH